MAAENGREEVIDLLIKKGADKDATDNDGNTIIHAAAFHCKPSVLEFLFNKGEDFTVVNNNGLTPLHKAAAPGFPHSTHTLLYLISIPEVDLTAIDKDGNTPLDLAGKDDYEEHSFILKDALTKQGKPVEAKQTKPEKQINQNIKETYENENSELATSNTEMQVRTEQLEEKLLLLKEEKLNMEITLKQKEAHLQAALERIMQQNNDLQLVKKKSLGMLQELEKKQQDLNKKRIEVESFQKKVLSKNKQVEELQSILEMKEEKIKVMEKQVSSSSDVIKQQKDEAVQFNYIVPVSDHLDSVLVAGEILFLIQGDRPQSLNWEEYGFKMHFPQGTIPPSDTCEVVVKAIVGGKFQFPEGTELVSAVYAVAFAKKILQPVEMEIQHCVNLTNQEQGKRLSFVSTAKQAKGQVLPYKFEFVEGGEFYSGKRYGSIKRMHFCKNAVVKKADSSPSDKSSPDDEKKAESSVSNDSYTGQMFYEREECNKWLMKFMVVKDIDAFLKYASTEHPNAKKDEMIRFSFLDTENGYIEMVMNAHQKYSNKGWKIIPHKEPLILRKRDADMFGLQQLPIPPSCLITLHAKLTEDTEEDLRYAVPLMGIDSDVSKIFINRSLETTETTSTSHQTKQPQHSISTAGSDDHQQKIPELIQLIKSGLTSNHAKLFLVFENSLIAVAREMYEAGLIDRAVQREPRYELIIDSFLAGIGLMEEQEEIEEHCVKFLSVLYKLGGPFHIAANKIKKVWMTRSSEELCLQLDISGTV